MDQQNVSLWHATGAAPRFDPLRGELQADVAVIGAGITGLTAALLLAQRGKSVVVLERETVGGGETGNTTAHITVALDAGYNYVRRKYSVEEARLVADAQRSAIEKIAELIERHGISCHFKRVPAYSYTEKRKYVSELKTEAAAAREAGLEAQWVEEVPLPFATRGAILWPNQAQFHAIEYLAGLAKACVEAGVRIFDRTLVTGVHDGEPCVVETENGGRVAAGCAVITNDSAAARVASVPMYTIAFRIADSLPQAICWDTDQHATWSESSALVVSGQEQPIASEDTASGYASVEAYVQHRYRGAETLARGRRTIHQTEDGLPVCAREGNVITLTGFGRNEATLGTIAAMVASDVMTGVVTRWATLLDAQRLAGSQAAAASGRAPATVSSGSSRPAG